MDKPTSDVALALLYDAWWNRRDTMTETDWDWLFKYVLGCDDATILEWKRTPHYRYPYYACHFAMQWHMTHQDEDLGA